MVQAHLSAISLVDHIPNLQGYYRLLVKLGRSASKLMKVKGQGVKGVSSLDIELCEGNAPWDRPSKSAMTSVKPILSVF